MTTQLRSLITEAESDMRQVKDWALLLFDGLSDAKPVDEAHAGALCNIAGELLGIGQRLDRRFNEIHEAAVSPPPASDGIDQDGEDDLVDDEGRGRPRPDRHDVAARRENFHLNLESQIEDLAGFGLALTCLEVESGTGAAVHTLGRAVSDIARELETLHAAIRRRAA